MASTKESLKLPNDCSRDEYEQFCDFVKKIKDIDKEPNHKGIFIQFHTALNLYKSKSLSLVDFKNRIATIFKNCDVLLASFDQIFKDSRSDDSRRHAIDVNTSNLKRMTDFVKTLRTDCKELRGKFIKAFEMYNEHGDVHSLKEEVDIILRDYPCLKKEFTMILVNYGLLRQDKKRYEITPNEEDKLFDDDMYFHAIDSALRFAAEEGNEKPSVGVYGAIRRFYKENGRRLTRAAMKYPKLVIRGNLIDFQIRYEELLMNKAKPLKKVQKVNESLLVFDDWVFN